MARKRKSPNPEVPDGNGGEPAEQPGQQRYLWLSVAEGKLTLLGYGPVELPSTIDPSSPAIEVCTRNQCFHLERTNPPKGLILPSSISAVYMAPRKDFLVGYDGNGYPRVLAVRHAERWLVADYPLELSPRPFRGVCVRFPFDSEADAERFLAWVHAQAKRLAEEGNDAPITDTFAETPVLVVYT